MNLGTFSGNLTGDLVLKYTANGKPFATAVLAVNDAGNTDFLPIKIWNEYSGTLAGILKKGSKIVATGRIENSQFERNGVKITYTELVVQHVEF